MQIHQERGCWKNVSHGVSSLRQEHGHWGWPLPLADWGLLPQISPQGPSPCSCPLLFKQLPLAGALCTHQCLNHSYSPGPNSDATVPSQRCLAHLSSQNSYLSRCWFVLQVGNPKSWFPKTSSPVFWIPGFEKVCLPSKQYLYRKSSLIQSVPFAWTTMV